MSVPIQGLGCCAMDAGQVIPALTHLGGIRVDVAGSGKSRRVNKHHGSKAT